MGERQQQQLRIPIKCQRQQRKHYDCAPVAAANCLDEERVASRSRHDVIRPKYTHKYRCESALSIGINCNSYHNNNITIQNMNNNNNNKCVLLSVLSTHRRMTRPKKKGALQLTVAVSADSSTQELSVPASSIISACHTSGLCLISASSGPLTANSAADWLLRFIHLTHSLALYSHSTFQSANSYNEFRSMH